MGFQIVKEGKNRELVCPECPDCRATICIIIDHDKEEIVEVDDDVVFTKPRQLACPICEAVLIYVFEEE